MEEKKHAGIAKLGRKLVRERLDIFLLFGIIAVLWPWGETEGYEHILWPAGAALSLGGLYLRAWSMKHCGKAGASEDGIKKLTTTGPYRIFRNPLYVANILIFTGLLALSEVLWIIPAFLVYAWVRYDSIVKREEGALILQFGGDYEDYCKKVPRWRPRLLLPLDRPRRSWGTVLNREAVEIACCAAGAVILLTKDIWLAGWILGK
jgi:protein-S-isoprenylcysteine O-methyltransferase Ste14